MSVFLVMFFGDALLTSPTVKYIPLWFPGAGFKRKAAEWRRGILKGISAPYEQVKKHMVLDDFLSQYGQNLNYFDLQAAGMALPSFTSRVLEDMPKGVTEELLMWVTGSMCELPASKWSKCPNQLL